MEERIQLPNGHLLNLNPRPRHFKPTGDAFRSQGTRRSQTPEHDTEGDQESGSPQERGLGSPPQYAMQKTKATKLPVPRSHTDRRNGNWRKVEIEDEDETEAGDAQAYASPPPSEPRSAGKDREQYWKKVRERFEKESPLPSKTRDRPKGYYQGAYRKIMSLANSPRQEIAKYKLKNGEGLNSKTGIPTPTSQSPQSSVNSSRGQPVRRRVNSRGVKRQGVDETWRQKSGRTDNNTDSSVNSNFSLSPVSGPGSSMTDWEDKFVVHMPSAREPNPPTMTSQQIAQFQTSIEKVHRAGEDMLDPETLPSPRSLSPETKDSLPKDTTKKQHACTGYDGQSGSVDEGEAQSTPLDPNHGRYYFCPEEIGKQRCSTIWEESARKTKKKPCNVNSDGSFLGCKEINGPTDKNPDEILLFCTVPERPKVVNVPAPAPKKPAQKSTAHPKASAAEKHIVQEEWKSVTQNLKHVQSPKPLPKTMCQETQCQRPEKSRIPTQPASKENTKPASSSNTSPKGQVENRKGGDAFITTPTTTNTMVGTEGTKRDTQKTPDPKQPVSQSRHSTTSIPLGLRPAVQLSQKKSDPPSTTSSQAASPTNIQSSKGRISPKLTGGESTKGIRGFIRTSGTVKSITENLNQPKHNDPRKPLCVSVTSEDHDAVPSRTVSETSPPGKVSPQPAISLSPPLRARGKVGRKEQSQAMEVAELDGQQVKDRQRGDFRFNTTGASADSQQTEGHDDKHQLDPLTLSLIFHILVLSIAYMQRLLIKLSTNRYPKIAFDIVLNMAEHCFHVLSRAWNALTIYRTTGSWPWPSHQDVGRVLADLSQTFVYLVTLGFIIMLVGRAAGYVVFVGSWIVWFARPFGWVFGAVGRLLQV
ncbi:hypothetical protein MW887_000376 [Aspergillus wentii]|nr:hypothetical protein MW887_000376 [Aspergillus wentii]